MMIYTFMYSMITIIEPEKMNPTDKRQLKEREQMNQTNNRQLKE